MQAKYFRLPASLKETLIHVLTAAGQSHYLTLFSFQEDEQPKRSSRKANSASSPIERITEKEIMGDGGIFAQKIPGFIPRTEQVKLTTYLINRLRRGENAIVEAGPGLGKTFAYLVAGLLTGGRLLISTHSKILQDQIVTKDIPRVLEALGLQRSYAKLKGRRNYVCGTRLRMCLETNSLSIEEAWILLKIVLWLARGGSGDLEQLNLSHLNQAVVSRLHADHSVCRKTSPACRPEICPYQKARQLAAAADIVVINHALLMQWGLEGSPYQAQFRQLIVDESHRLEETAQQAAQIEFSLARLEGTLEHVRDSSALLKDFQNLLKTAEDVINSHTQGIRLRLSQSARRSQTGKRFLGEGQRFLQRLRFTIGLEKGNSEPLTDTINRLERLAIEWEEMLTGKSRDLVHYLSCPVRAENGKIISTSLNVAPYLQPALESFSPTVLLSATVTTAGNFSYVKERLGISSWKEKSFSSAFDYASQMSLLVAEDGPYANQESHDLFVATLISNIGKYTQGKIVVLFTSKKSLESVYKNSSSQLYKENINLFAQGISGGRHNIVRRFQESRKAILFGLASFWEGFDIPGEALSILIIPKLPFPAPSDPVIEALSETAGGEAFSKVMLPRMILRLKQGLGRLIRSVSDRGVVVILDRRLAEKGYGREVLHSLPACPIEVVGASDLPAKIAEFFGPETIARWQNNK